jgi:hypothetical protein
VAEPFLNASRQVAEALGLAWERGGLRVALGDEDETHALWIARSDDLAGRVLAQAGLPFELQARLVVSVADGLGAPWRRYAPVRTLERRFAPARFCSVLRLRVAPQDGERLLEGWLSPVLSQVAAHPELVSVVALRAVDDPGQFLALAEWRRPVGPALSRELLRATPPPVPLLGFDRLVGRIDQAGERFALAAGVALAPA